MSESSFAERRARTKIVATVGPACRDRQTLADIVAAGVDVFRLNMAHGDTHQHEATISAIREISQQRLEPIGILVDLAGPKIRLGQLVEDPLQCSEGAEFVFVRGDRALKPNELVSIYDRLVDELSVSDSVMLADGTVTMIVEEKSTDHVRCRVTLPGVLRSRQGINLPGVNLSVPSLTDADLVNARWAAQNNIDFVGLSFVRTANEILQLKEILTAEGSHAWVVAKIEKPDALENLEDIVSASDAVMIARGDLGVETDVADMAIVQKRIIRTCNRLGRPVIVATQMLDSMQHSSRPTRAEATDVANAILDGADACMLSGETAIGDFPRESVQMMNRIMLSTEQNLVDTRIHDGAAAPVIGVHPITSAAVYGAGKIAERLFAKLTVVVTQSGSAALAKSSQRDFIPTIAVSGSPHALRRATLFWGIVPILGVPGLSGDSLRRFVNGWGKRVGLLASGDRVVMVIGSGINPGAHNQVEIYEVD